MWAKQNQNPSWIFCNQNKPCFFLQFSDKLFSQNCSVTVVGVCRRGWQIIECCNLKTDLAQGPIHLQKIDKWITQEIYLLNYNNSTFLENILVIKSYMTLSTFNKKQSTRTILKQYKRYSLHCVVRCIQNILWVTRKGI